MVEQHTQERFQGRNWPHWETPSFVTVDGLETAYRRKGSGAKTLFLHGAGLTRIWPPFAEQLAQQVDLIYPEHPGFGDTPRPNEFRSLEDYVLHYDALIRELQLDGELHLVAHSLGGWLATLLATYYPERFASLTLITPTGLRLMDVASIDTFRMLDDEMAGALFNGRASRYPEFAEQEGFPQDTIREYGESTTEGLLSWNPRYDWRFDHRLQRVQMPSLVIGVEEDRIVPTEMAARFAELLPNATLQTVSGPDGEPSSHLVQIEQPEEVSALVAAHIEQHRAAGAK